MDRMDYEPQTDVGQGFIDATVRWRRWFRCQSVVMRRLTYELCLTDRMDRCHILMLSRLRYHADEGKGSKNATV